MPHLALVHPTHQKWSTAADESLRGPALINPSKQAKNASYTDSGKLIIDLCTITERPSFLDFIAGSRSVDLHIHDASRRCSLFEVHSKLHAVINQNIRVLAYVDTSLKGCGESFVGSPSVLMKRSEKVEGAS